MHIKNYSQNKLMTLINIKEKRGKKKKKKKKKFRN